MSEKLYPVSDKDIKAIRDQEENGTNSYSKINQSIINRFKKDLDKREDRKDFSDRKPKKEREMPKKPKPREEREMTKDLYPASDKDIEILKKGKK
jgi:hypothetical protein